MKWYKSGVSWGGPTDDWYYIFWWNWLPPHLRYIGYVQDWYDGPLSSFGLWFTNITWTLPFTGHNGKIDFSYHTKKKPVDTKSK